MDFSFNTGKSLLRNVHSNSVMSIIDCWIVPSRIDFRILGRELLVELSYVDSYAIYGFKTTNIDTGLGFDRHFLGIPISTHKRRQLIGICVLLNCIWFRVPIRKHPHQEKQKFFIFSLGLGKPKRVWRVQSNVGSFYRRNMDLLTRTAISILMIDQ